MQNLLVWAVGLCMAGLAAWLLPRLALSLALGVVNVPYTLWKQGFAQPLAEVVARKSFLLAGASVSFLAAYVAYLSRRCAVLNRHISPLQPVLRSNLWLTFHVLTITSSYAAGVLAWALGNIALAWYLFGHYREPSGEWPMASGEFRSAGDAGSGTQGERGARVELAESPSQQSPATLSSPGGHAGWHRVPRRGFRRRFARRWEASSTR